jgi:hypothetical protein
MLFLNLRNSWTAHMQVMNAEELMHQEVAKLPLPNDGWKLWGKYIAAPMMDSYEVYTVVWRQRSLVGSRLL